MIFIGVTGGIGSGKSLVCSLFEKKGIPIFFADTIAKEVPQKNAKVLKEISDVFGPDIVNVPAKTIDNKKLAAIVFSEHEKLQQLNAILHPKVFDEFQKWKKAVNQSCHFALVEAALIFESGMDEILDYVLAVTSDESTRIQRVMRRDAASEEQVRARMHRQMPAEGLAELSDFVLHNDGSIDDLTSKIDFLHSLFSTLKERTDVQ
ncbi:MAG: dephospho-CoA kinase [Bacteroidota bacterium]|nr:dephospho-CoA kinase [Bacteroidota bacterium]